MSREAVGRIGLSGNLKVQSKHRERTSGIGKGNCVQCREEWPCEVVLLRKLIEDFFGGKVSRSEILRIAARDEETPDRCESCGENIEEGYDVKTDDGHTYCTDCYAP